MLVYRTNGKRDTNCYKLLAMACFWKYVNDTYIKIPNVKEIENITFYLIEIRIDTVTWTVSHRYNEFYDLHQTLCSEHGVSKVLLPPKRPIGNKSPTFIENRRQALEVYLQDIFSYLKFTMPRVFIEFLDFHVYDTFYLLKNLASYFYSNADSILKFGKSYKFNPVELYAISVCFKEPFPNTVDADSRYDLSHVLDLCSQLLTLTIEGNPHKYLLSNIQPDLLKIDLSSFKCLQTLIVQEMSLENIYNLGNLRTSLKVLNLTKTSTTNLSQILQCDILHKSQVEDSQVCCISKQNNRRSPLWATDYQYYFPHIKELTLGVLGIADNKEDTYIFKCNINQCNYFVASFGTWLYYRKSR
ncbi:hypothetical protein AMK59_7033 [Oryctes borbonicus]|uniref:PX domain-containing protein n=1 Tax=Oryctes borbonicus TaxID=1629725 RepID=A0A0T6AWQ6_9SCAR|nr:hypothetical protein AMK59_7033 [Oryctes borbonicus]